MRRLLLAALLAFAAFTHLWGVRRDLPHAPHSDEVRFFLIAAQMATAGDPDPHWFGHPGSTLLYPYALGLHALGATESGSWLSADPALADRFAQSPTAPFVVGRVLSIAYALLSLVVVCAIGDRVFGPPVGLVGAWLSLLSPLALDHAMMVRTDTAGLFFGVLGLWACVRLLDRPTRAAHAVAGLVIGFGVATRYFLVALVPVLLTVDAALLLRRRSTDTSRAEGERPSALLLGLVAIPIGFLLAAPYLVTDIARVQADLAHEARTSHPGADGFGFFGNLAWYFGYAMPRALSPVVLVLAAGCALLSAWRRNLGALLLLEFVAIFLIGISISPLHWARWLIQILPLIALLGAAALVAVVNAVALRLGLADGRARGLAVAAAVAAVSTMPALRYLDFALLQGAPSTKQIARDWARENLDPSEPIAAELYSAPLQDTPLAPRYAFSLTEMAETPEALQQAGFEIAMVSSSVYGRYLSEPARYPREVAFYRKLFRKGQLVEQFAPGTERRGPVIRIYRLRSG
ncbi:MAG: glycosyltransferase family 39 protein [Deltaproteobacteria bacterium]|nr:glycosyltransferase family 39 protein [Deltaproteobacteria bacterium]